MRARSVPSGMENGHPLRLSSEVQSANIQLMSEADEVSKPETSSYRSDEQPLNIDLNDSTCGVLKPETSSASSPPQP